MESYTGQPVIGVGAILARPDGAVLLGYRDKPGESPCWCLPGGHVDAGESFEAAAVREVAEETGISELQRPKLLAVTQNLNSAASIITGAVLANVEQEADALVLEPEVFTQWRWFRAGALPTPLFPASQAVLAHWRGHEPPTGWLTYPIVPVA
ncbi:MULTISPECIES: nucleotide triphosphate diphosphatase NUDT15 [unclassified Halomonas]|uniref:nucleotide triphosphate diphosphatase NUDT15 n=1 Tax=unclassified Halomonas TaxID=2609666 RepID=UPI0006D9D6AF|nr:MULTISPECIES: NUDIX domain-containing protein [unclassified Halomonas]KPQ22565.1 MAG: ADP-ribose pyrophosphatase [Halomonas sp. HL-93]SBR45823.1 ADP-ribose pyrophosphatase YjhB, NUDIX family [Halomonas sp. HL-93]SNY98465.1 ADP-ribose pyrophosphatase YjhB, NUDIX family [Halomonas sp. hl-4]